MAVARLPEHDAIEPFDRHGAGVELLHDFRDRQRVQVRRQIVEQRHVQDRRRVLLPGLHVFAFDAEGERDDFVVEIHVKRHRVAETEQLHAVGQVADFPGEEAARPLRLDGEIDLPDAALEASREASRQRLAVRALFVHGFELRHLLRDVADRVEHAALDPQVFEGEPDHPGFGCFSVQFGM